jgi:hypothetical protein
MAKDIYGIEDRNLETWIMDGVVISLSDGDALTIQSLSLQYPRGMIKIQPLNRRRRLLLVGSSDGTMQLGTIIGPNAAIKTFIERYADPCQVSGNVITLRPNGVRTCDNGENNVVDPLEFVCSNCLLADIGISVSQVGTMATVTAGLAMSFEGLKIN